MKLGICKKKLKFLTLKLKNLATWRKLLKSSWKRLLNPCKQNESKDMRLKKSLITRTIQNQCFNLETWLFPFRYAYMFITVTNMQSLTVHWLSYIVTACPFGLFNGWAETKYFNFEKTFSRKTTSTCPGNWWRWCSWVLLNCR